MDTKRERDVAASEPEHTFLHYWRLLGGDEETQTEYEFHS